MRIRFIAATALAMMIAAPAFAAQTYGPKERAQSPWVRKIACSPSDTQACIKCVREGGTTASCKICDGCRN
jgi:hypothetical protein